MVQDRAHVHGDAKRNGIEIIMGASAVADRDINGLGRRNTQASAKSVVRRQARTACGLMALQERRAVTGGARSDPNNPAVYRLRSPGRGIEGRSRYAKPISNVIRGSDLEVGEFSVGSKRPPIDERIGYRVRKAHLKE